MTLDPEVSKAVNEFAITILGLITTVFVPWAFSLFRAWAKAKIESVKNKEVRDAMNDALTRLDLTAETVVKEVNQTLKDKVAVDGKLTEKTGHDLLRVAYARLKSRLPADAMATLKNAFPDSAENENLLQKVIVGKIEKTVGDAKTPCVT
jgi:hypothetical protein